MAKEHGLGNALYIGGIDVSGEARNWDVTSPVQTLDVTGIRKLAPERIWGLKSAAFKWNSHLDPLSLGYLSLSLLPRTDGLITLAHRETIGAPAMSVTAKQLGYDPVRDDKGQVVFTVDADSNEAFADWGVMATAGLRVDTTATNGPGVDHGAVPLNPTGLQAYLHVAAFTGTSVTIKLQQSSDDGVGDAYADVVGGSFGAISAAPQALRLVTARNQAVERYVRVVTSGTFTSATFAVALVVNDIQVDL